jgi:hypothetical protein
MILAMLFLAGWYALAPPEAEVKGEMRYFPTAPLYRWSQERAFDSASECEAWRAAEMAEVMADFQRWGKEEDREGRLLFQIAQGRLRWIPLMICVRSDDYRLLRRP